MIKPAAVNRVSASLSLTVSASPYIEVSKSVMNSESEKSPITGHWGRERMREPMKVRTRMPIKYGSVAQFWLERPTDNREVTQVFRVFKSHHSYHPR